MSALPLQTPRLIVTLPQPELAAPMLDFARRNREHLSPWNPPEPPGLYTLDHWRGVVERATQAFGDGSGVRLWIVARDTPDRVIGSIGFSQIARGPFCSCVLGYQIDRECQGKGMMREALEAAIPYMFNEQKLHRIAANYRPENLRSGRLLASLGFRIEGYAKNYLFIDGDWRDHILTAIVNDMFKPAWITMR